MTADMEHGAALDAFETGGSSPPSS